MSPAGRNVSRPDLIEGSAFGLNLDPNVNSNSKKSQVPHRKFSGKSVFASVYSAPTNKTNRTRLSKKSERLVRKSKLTAIVQEAELLQKLYRSNTRDKQQYF